MTHTRPMMTSYLTKCPAAYDVDDTSASALMAGNIGSLLSRMNHTL